jgi:hypothetical protein
VAAAGEFSAWLRLPCARARSPPSPPAPRQRFPRGLPFSPPPPPPSLLLGLLVGVANDERVFATTLLQSLNPRVATRRVASATHRLT